MRLTSEICGVLNMNVLLFLEFGDFSVKNVSEHNARDPIYGDNPMVSPTTVVIDSMRCHG